MKQKYSIAVADMQLNIISDASRDEVENVVGILDRRMRDIHLKSPRCTKNEAAILCALSYCSERIAVQEAYQKAEKDAYRYAAENERLKKAMEELRAELEAVRQDNAAMRSIVGRPAEAPQQPVAENREPDPAPAREEPAATTTNGVKAANRSRVGTMFDLLTFSDI